MNLGGGGGSMEPQPVSYITLSCHQTRQIGLVLVLCSVEGLGLCVIQLEIVNK